MAKRVARGTPKAVTRTPAERPLLVESPHAEEEGQGAGSSDGGYESGNESPYDSEEGLSDAGLGSEDGGSTDGEQSDSESGSGDEDTAGPPSDSSDDEFGAAVVDLLEASASDQDGTTVSLTTAPGDDERPDEPAYSAPASDSSEDERENRNTVGEVPLEWYKDELHIGYDREGRKVSKGPRRDKLDALLARNDGGAAWRTVYDEYNGEEITLSKEEMKMIQRIREGKFPHVEVDPYPDEDDWYTRDVSIHPLQGGPEPKRRFIPSKWEEKKVVKLVRALRKGWIKRDKDKVPEQPPVYMLWQDDGLAADHTMAGLSYIPAPKTKLPGHEESYQPPQEYLPTEEERATAALNQEPGEKAALLPQCHDSLRLVPAYADFIKERFERCLDLYLCPRVRRRRIQVDDPQQLVPKLPQPKDLQPFPQQMALRFIGHQSRVLSVAPDASGQWLASGSADGSMRLWEVATARCVRVWDLGSPVSSVAWCPNPALHVLSAVSGHTAVLTWSGVGDEECEEAAVEALTVVAVPASDVAPAVRWEARGGGGMQLVHKHTLAQITWHSRGDYFATVAPTANTQAVMIHQLSKQATQNPFRKNRGRVQRVLFHPSKPFLLVATQHHVRIYNLAKQALARKLLGSSGAFTCLAIHSSGDHVIAGGEDRRLAWYDLDLSAKPYKALRYHKAAVRGAAFHRTYPLFASTSDDGAIHVFHGAVYQDLMTNPLIVPVKILRGHKVVDYQGVLDVAFHPTQPWLFSAGADSEIHMYTNC